MRKGNDPVILGYYPSWTPEVGPDKIDYRMFTHLAHAFAVPGKNGAMDLPDARQSHDLCAQAHRAKTRVLLAVGGADSGSALSAAMRDGPSAERLVAQLTEAVSRSGYDGIDIDWEFAESVEDSHRLTDLVRRVRAALPADALVTMAVSAGDWQGRWFETAALIPLVDWVSVMTYDFHGTWSDHAGHNAPLYPDKKDTRDGAQCHLGAALGYWTEKRLWPPEKLLIGIPAYGRGFAVRHWYEKPEKPAAHGYISFREITGLIAQGWKRQQDHDAGVPYLISPEGTELISYEDEASAAAKGRWSHEKRVRGIFFWEITEDWIGGTHHLVAAARREFLRK